MAFFDFRFTAKFLEKSDIRIINAPQLLLYRLTWQGIPMWVRRPFQIGYVKAYCLVVGIRQSVFIPLTVPLMEVFMHLPHIVKQVTKPNTIGLVAKLILVGFHGISHITPFLTPVQWVGRHTIKRLC